MDCVKKVNENICKKTVENLISRHFEAYYCEDLFSAKEKVLSLIGEGDTVSWGGSMTVAELGIVDLLKSGNYNVIDRADFPPEQREEIYRNAFFADTYLTSANGISENGEIVNIDGTANRVAAMCFGPKQVIMIVGVNKIAKDLDAAIKRARNIAAPTNAQRFDISTPCHQTGFCADCKCIDSICCQMLITRLCRPKGRIKVIVVNEFLGF